MEGNTQMIYGDRENLLTIQIYVVKFNRPVTLI